MRGTAINSCASTAIFNPATATSGWRCTKRDGKVVPFDHAKIRKAVSNCFIATYYDNVAPVIGEIEPVVDDVTRSAIAAIAARGIDQPSVEDVQDFVIQQLWMKGLFPAAKHYQNYREEHRKVRELETASLFLKRVEFKPFEYPEAEAFKEKMQFAPWLHSHFEFTSDEQDYHVHLQSHERTSACRTVLAISQIEVQMKRFWAKLGDRIQKPEIEQVGVVFGESEVRHADAYSRILDVLSLNDAFKGVTRVPAIRARIEYLNRAMRSGMANGDRGFAKTLAVFALLVENVSLFSQFCIIKSFSKHKGRLQNIDNVVQATQKEEEVHAKFGVWLTNLIKSERPDWFDKAFYADLRQTCVEAYEAECNILDWIFADGAIPSVSRPALAEFLKNRVNMGVTAIGGEPVFDVSPSLLSETEWFYEETKAPIDVDFFHKHSTSYSSGQQAVTTNSMWDD